MAQVRWHGETFLGGFLSRLTGQFIDKGRNSGVGGWEPGTPTKDDRLKLARISGAEASGTVKQKLKLKKQSYLVAGCPTTAAAAPRALERVWQP